ncbi:MAG TPA: hypothetical protein VLA11_06125, partial [Woeseiaceae bacterium]|nr:hypothetical protein [Woeseiaceae bacterium]
PELLMFIYFFTYKSIIESLIIFPCRCFLKCGKIACIAAEYGDPLVHQTVGVRVFTAIDALHPIVALSSSKRMGKEENPGPGGKPSNGIRCIGIHVWPSPIIPMRQVKSVMRTSRNAFRSSCQGPSSCWALAAPPNDMTNARVPVVMSRDIETPYIRGTIPFTS